MKNHFIAFTTTLILSAYSFAYGQSINAVTNFNGNSPIGPDHFIQAHGIVFFTDEVQHLWATDGTPMGTSKVGTVPIYATNLFSMNGALFFSGWPTNVNTGFELYKFDPALATYALIKDIYSGGSFSSPSNFIPIGNTLYFSADDGVHGRELWKSDGTEAGTLLVKDINIGASSGDFINPVVYNNTLYFGALDPVNGFSLWKSDGTESGTVLVKDCNPTSVGTPAQNLTVINNKIFFAADDGVNGAELWQSDGTSQGTFLIKDLKPGTSGSTPQKFTAAGVLTFFAANENELWVTDGSASGTLLLKVFYKIKAMSFYGNQFYVNAQSSFSNETNELWTSDGTVIGTLFISNKAFADGLLINSQWYKIQNKTPSLSGFEIIKSEGTECKTKTVIATSSEKPFSSDYIAWGSKIFINARNSVTNKDILYLYDTSADPGFSCQQQIISFAPVPAQKYGGTLELAASATSGLAVSYSLSGDAIATLTNNKLTFVGVGTLNVTASQNGNDAFDPAARVSQQVIVNKGEQIINFPLISPQLINQQLVVSASSSSGLAVTLQTPTPDKVTVLSGNIVSFIKEGKATVTANQGGNVYYNAAAQVSQTFCINPSQPVISSDGMFNNSTLSSSNLSGNQWFKDDSLIPGATGKTFKPEESGIYWVQTTIDGCFSKKSDSFPVVITGIENENAPIILFPNPVENILRIKLEGDPSVILISNTLGKLVLQHTTYGERTMELNISDLPAGVYLVEIQTTNHKTINRIVKK